MLARSFLIESSSKLLVTRTGIKAWTILISGQIRLLTLELLSLEWRKFYTFELEYLWGQLANVDQILCVASLGVGKGCIMFWGRLDQNSGVHGNRKPPLTYNGENGVSTFSRLLLIRSFLYLQVTRTCIESWTSSNFGQIWPLTKEQGYRNFEIQIGPLDRWRHRRYTNMNSTIPNSHENSSFSSKSVSEIDYFSDTVQLQPVVSKLSRDNPKSLATDRCLIQGSINIRCGVWIHLFFKCPKGSLFFL